LPGAAADQILAQWLDKLLSRQVPPELQLDLLDAAAKRQAREVKERLAAFEKSRPAEDELRSFRECLQGGNVEEGRKIFIEKVEVSCIRCHKAGAGTEGGEVGPDLAGLVTRKSREYILESIVFPNKEIAAGFDSLLVTMNNGALYAGVLKSENQTEIELNSPEDGLLKLKKAEVKSRQRGLSAMPEEFRQVLTKQELRDLVEFIGSVK
jgi:quinoprotein glucose dehydrogenase